MTKPKPTKSIDQQSTSINTTTTNRLQQRRRRLIIKRSSRMLPLFTHNRSLLRLRHGFIVTNINTISLHVR
ncbi:hypothetical protein Hanom_Chr03g00276411 [Helianthus anomalus]